MSESSHEYYQDAPMNMEELLKQEELEKRQSESHKLAKSLERLSESRMKSKKRNLPSIHKQSLI